MKIHIAHADTCLPDYWAGHHRPHVGIIVYNGMSFADVRRAIRDEVRMGCIMGSDDDDARYLKDDVVNDPAYADELTRAVYASIERDVRPARKGARNAFPDLSKDENEDTPVMAYFVFMREGERHSIETHVNWPDYRIREGEPRAARIIFRDGETRYFVAGTEYGYLHTTGGDLRTWKTASAARRKAKQYTEDRA